MRSAAWSRRAFLGAAARAAAIASSALAGCRSGRGGGAAPAGEPFFRTRGIVLVPDDLTLADWPERAGAAGLTTIALHHGLRPSIVAAFVRSAGGQAFLDRCRALGLQVEYELHAMAELLPRELFARDPALFRMDERGARVADANLCVHSETALGIAAENAVRIDAELRPTTHRRFLWGDDGAPWCLCPRCASLSASDQALVVENRLVAALRRVDPAAALAHLAYANTLEPPRQVRPAEGIFLEFAPIDVRVQRPLTRLADPADVEALGRLDANLSLFPRETAQALDYWLDASLQSGWRRPARELRFDEEAFADDLETYASRGVRHVASFAVYVDADYVARFGFPPAVRRYGDRLRGRRAGQPRREVHASAVIRHAPPVRTSWKASMP